MGLPNFHHHPDGWIFVRTEQNIYQDTPGNFILDSGLEYDPTGIIERFYEPGVRHILNGQPQPLTWELGDQIIAMIGDLLTVQDARRNPPPALGDSQLVAINNVTGQLYEQRKLWQNAYAGNGDWLVILQAVEAALQATWQATMDMIQAATTTEEIDGIMADLTWPPVPDQAGIEADVGDSLAAKAEALQFLDEYPNARLLIELDYADLIEAIQNRTAGQETLLLMTLAFSVRYLKQLLR